MIYITFFNFTSVIRGNWSLSEMELSSKPLGIQKLKESTTSSTQALGKKRLTFSHERCYAQGAGRTGDTVITAQKRATFHVVKCYSWGLSLMLWFWKDALACHGTFTSLLCSFIVSYHVCTKNLRIYSLSFTKRNVSNPSFIYVWHFCWLSSLFPSVFLHVLSFIVKRWWMTFAEHLTDGSHNKGLLPRI